MQLSAKVEQAYEKILALNGSLPIDMKVFKGIENEEMAHPCVVIHAHPGSVEEPQGSGNRFVEVDIIVISDAEPMNRDGTEGLAVDPIDLHNENVDAVAAILKVDTLPDHLSDQVGQFHCYSPIDDIGTDHTVEERSFRDTLRFRVYCGGSDLT